MFCFIAINYITSAPKSFIEKFSSFLLAFVYILIDSLCKNFLSLIKFFIRRVMVIMIVSYRENVTIIRNFFYLPVGFIQRLNFFWVGGSPYRDGPRAADASIKIFASSVSMKVAIDRTPRESDAISFKFIFPDIIHHNNNRSIEENRIKGEHSSGVLPRMMPPRQIFFHRHCCLLLFPFYP